MKKYLSLIGLLVLTQQSPARTTSSIVLGQASIDSTLLEARMYKVIGDRSEALKDLPSSFPVMIFNQKSIDASGATSFTPVGFAVNCKGRDPRAVVNAFGEAFLDIDNPEVVTEEDLNTQFHVAEQPILRCDSLYGQNQASPMFSQVFRVIDRAAKKSYSLVRFNAFSPQDKRLYEVACSNMLDAFWRETDSVKSTVILKESLKDLPGADQLGALHCYNTATPIAPNLSMATFSEPDAVFDARLYRVEDQELGLVRVLLSGGRTFRLNCASSDAELQTAFGFPATGKLPTITSADAAFNDYISGQMDQQPALNCPSLTRPLFASDAYHITNFVGLESRAATRNPLLRLSAAQDALVQFSCESSVNFFAKKLVDELKAEPAKLQPITWESADFLVRTYVPGQLKARRYTLGCAPSTLQIADIKQIIRDVQGREPISSEVSRHMNQCSSQGEICTNPWMEQKIVEKAAETPVSASRVIHGAFSAALGRAPQPEELNLLLQKTKAGGPLRVHSKELAALLKSSKFLDRKLFIAATVQATGTEYFGDAMDLWTSKQFDNPIKVYTADIFKAELEAYIKAQFLDEIIKRAYEDNYWSGIQPFQINAMKQKITAGTVKGLYQDMVTLLSKTGQECVTVASNKEDQTFTFFKPRYFVASVSGKWTADKVAYPQVGPTGHPSSTSGHERIDKKYALGQLLISSKDNKGAWLPWVGWNGALSYDHYLNEVKMVMNDYRTSFGDNSGSIKVCFE